MHITHPLGHRLGDALGPQASRAVAHSPLAAAQGPHNQEVVIRRGWTARTGVRTRPPRASVRGFRLLMLAIALAGVGIAVAPARQAQAADGVWACSPAAGHTWDRVENRLNVCQPGQFAYSYHLRIPVNGLNACWPPPGFTWDRVENRLNVCQPGGFAYSYALRAPAPGSWVCHVPPGWTFTGTMSQLNVCQPGGFATSYRLA